MTGCLQVGAIDSTKQDSSIVNYSEGELHVESLTTGNRDACR